ncbi:MAG: hypothetical protein GY789_02305 [Hyphomicrobiales bacterium]|nr:hypothetical protein [Hyphomicrobiales bacterium]
MHYLPPVIIRSATIGGYGTGPLLEWLVQERGIAPHIPVVDKSGRTDGTFERADFTFDTKNDAYICPGGKELKQSRRAFTTPRTPIVMAVSSRPQHYEQTLEKVS